jgi:hypothetical protein
MMGAAATGFATRTAENAADSATNSQAMSDMVGNFSTQIVALQQKKSLVQYVQKQANRPVKDYSIVPSVAFEGLRRDYLLLCSGDEGGLQIVYDRLGMGKTRALQGVARAKSLQQPHRFLVINISYSTMTCDQLYKYIQAQLGVANLGLQPHEVAEVVRYGLLGPANQDGSQANLPATANSCRLTIDSPVRSIKKKNNFPILVIDEFNPRDFTDEDWPDGTDFSLQQVAEKMGEAFEFFSALAGMAYARDGFVVFLGTRSKAVARALLEINCGTKAALAPCTKRDELVGRFEDWQGFDWTDEGKQRLLTNMYENDYKKALRAQGLSDENEIENKWLYVVSECISQPNIRGMCDAMKVELDAKNDQGSVLLQSRTEESVRAECCFDLAGQVGDTCIIM